MCRYIFIKQIFIEYLFYISYYCKVNMQANNYESFNRDRETLDVNCTGYI